MNYLFCLVKSVLNRFDGIFRRSRSALFPTRNETSTIGHSGINYRWRQSTRVECRIRMARENCVRNRERDVNFPGCSSWFQWKTRGSRLRIILPCKGHAISPLSNFLFSQWKSRVQFEGNSSAFQYACASNSWQSRESRSKSRPRFQSGGIINSGLMSPTANRSGINIIVESLESSWIITSYVNKLIYFLLVFA